MHTVATEHGEIAYEKRGNGPPLLLLHANPGSHLDYEAVVGPLAAQWSVYAVDWPGYGGSQAPRPPSSASAVLYADLLPGFVAALGLERVSLIGNSLGGFAAARLAITHPDLVQALVLVDSGGFTKHNAFTRAFCAFMGSECVTKRVSGPFASYYLKNKTPTVEAMIARAKGDASEPATVAVEAAIWRSFATPESDLRELAKRITTPTLIVWGARDPNLPIAKDGRHAREAIPDAPFEAMNTGHAPFAEDPDGFIELVLPFLASHTPR
jgi:pimeloyl-ACP methyl ester carboxylesterase